jgi:hypothetical protein
MNRTGFAITGSKGFQVTFTNGLTVSVQWGAANYCDNRARNLTADDMRELSSTTAEVLVENESGRNLTSKVAPRGANSDGLVVGWASPDTVAAIIHAAANWKE